MSQSNVVPLVRDGHPALLSVPKRTNLTFYYVGMTVFGFPGQPPPLHTGSKSFNIAPTILNLIPLPLNPDNTRRIAISKYRIIPKTFII